MKKIFSILIIAAALFFPQCNRPDPVSPNNNNPPGDNNPPIGHITPDPGVRIRGKITGVHKSSNTLSLMDAKKVLLFSKYYYNLTDITADSVSVTAQFGTCVALIFLDSGNHYIGNLSSHGMNMLPLGSLVDGENTVIDLSALTLVGTSVIPSHDPFGNEIQISETELQSLKAIDSYYESLAKNIDTDNDGVPDVLAKKQLVVTTRFAVFAGHWGYNDSAATFPHNADYYVNYSMEIAGGSALTFENEDITLSGPVVGPYPDIMRHSLMKGSAVGGDRAFIAWFLRAENAPPGAPWGTSFLPFKKGTYTLTLDGSRAFTLNYSSIDVKDNLVIVIPTLRTNSEGKLTSITFEYQLPGGASVNPACMLTNVMVQLTDTTAYQFYVNDIHKLTTATGFVKLTLDSPVDISSLYGMGVWYDDVLGNQYDIEWR